MESYFDNRVVNTAIIDDLAEIWSTLGAMSRRQCVIKVELPVRRSGGEIRVARTVANPKVWRTTPACVVCRWIVFVYNQVRGIWQFRDVCLRAVIGIQLRVDYGPAPQVVRSCQPDFGWVLASTLPVINTNICVGTGRVARLEDPKDIEVTIAVGVDGAAPNLLHDSWR